MLKLSKKTEYAILALHYIASQKKGKQTRLVSAKEMSELLNIPFDFLAKTLQTLMKAGLIKSVQGIKGGYELMKPANKITLSNILESVEGKQAIVTCFKNELDQTCNRVPECTIRKQMTRIQKKINNILESTTIDELSKA